MMNKSAKRRVPGKNALNHGYYSGDVVLPFESRRDFECLHTSLRDELHPVGQLEEEIVFDIAHLSWQRRRVRKMWHAAAYADPFVVDLIEADCRSWSGIRAHLGREAEGEHSLVSALHDQVKALTKQLTKAGRRAAEEGEPDKMDAAAQIAAATQAVLKLQQVIQSGPGPTDTFKRTYEPDSQEKIVRLEALIDTRLDKLLARLERVKAFKRLSLPAVPVPKLAPQPCSQPRVDGPEMAPQSEPKADSRDDDDDDDDDDDLLQLPDD